MVNMQVQHVLCRISAEVGWHLQSLGVGRLRCGEDSVQPTDEATLQDGL